MNVSRLTIVLTVLAYFLSLAALPYLPDQVVIHWNAAGEADGFSNKWVGAFLPPLLMTGLLIFMSALPKFDPKKRQLQPLSKNAIVLSTRRLPAFSCSCIL